MRNFIKIIIVTLLLLPFGMRAQGVAERDTLRLSLYFKTNITVPTDESRQNIERAMSVIRSSTDITRIAIEGWASPEGSEENNAKIASRRADAAEMFLREYFPLPDNVTKNRGTDWRGLMQFSGKMFSGDELEHIGSAMRRSVADRKMSLMKMNGGETWKRMNSEIFPLLRRADITIVFWNRRAEDSSRTVSVPAGTDVDYVSRRDTVVVYHKDTVYYMPVDRKLDPLRVQALYPRVDRNLRRPVLAFRSNLLLPLLNVGVEYPISNRWSVAADFYYPWCPREWMNTWTASQMNCLQGLGGFLEGRFWFGPEHRASEPDYGKYRLLGHSLGLIAGAAYYDVEYGGAGQQGELYAAGIGYTYALPLGKKGGVHMEFDIAVGAVYHMWHPYDVRETGGYLLHRKDENNISVRTVSQWHVLPIRAGVSLVVPIITDRPLVTRKKTGR